MDLTLKFNLRIFMGSKGMEIYTTSMTAVILTKTFDFLDKFWKRGGYDPNYE